jgi:hypothetical protein
MNCSFSGELADGMHHVSAFTGVPPAGVNDPEKVFSR